MSARFAISDVAGRRRYCGLGPADWRRLGRPTSRRRLGAAAVAEAPGSFVHPQLVAQVLRVGRLEGRTLGHVS